VVSPGRQTPGDLTIKETEMGSIGIAEMVVLLVVVLVLFGPGKLPEVGKSLGKAIGEFRKGIREGLEDRPQVRKSDSDNSLKPL
jgi:sec-independent protein translocase protein TatA